VAEFYFDHNISVEIAELLRLSGHVAVTADELGLSRATDDVHLLVAADRGAILVTHNRKDFELLHDAWRRWSAAWGVAPVHGGILILAQLNPTWVPRMAQAIASFIESNPALATALYTWHPVRGWQPRA
jgi:Domain of unknown function (DUF5615)